MNRAKTLVLTLLLLLSIVTLRAQNNFDFKGQLSLFGNYAPKNDLDFLFGGRYLPEASYAISLDSTTTLDFLASANLFGNAGFHPFDESKGYGSIDPYRVWARVKGSQYEVRVGLQKIDFGVATVLRPLQWFNQVDPRDPLGITNGVYAALGRYYFLNNANIWFWVLYQNEDLKGFELLHTNKNIPEIGGRVQLPIPRGEIGLSYHHRSVDPADYEELQSYSEIPENRYGLDIKWDVTIGLWTEVSHIHKQRYLSELTNQTLINVGADYTFGIGSGLNVVVEHLLSTTDEQAFHFENIANATAITLAYPLGMFDNLSFIATQSWETSNTALFANYEHQFNKFSGYVMAFYNPDTQSVLVESKQDFTLAGPGIRLMLVFNH